MTDTDKDTYITRFRVPRLMWDAYGHVVERLDTTRSARLLDHIRAEIKKHGTAQDLAALEAAEQELVARRSRKGGRPRKQPDTTEEA